MANLGKRDGGQGQQGGSESQERLQTQRNQPQRGEVSRRDPFQELMRDPFQLLTQDPWQVMREMMVDPWRMLRGMGRGGGMNVGFDVRETDDAFIFKGDIPGMRAEDIDISLAGNQLRISGNRQHEEEHEQGQMHTYERSYGSFTRTFALPESAELDKIKCDLADGVLSVVVPKRAGTSPQRRKIPIGSGSKS